MKTFLLIALLATGFAGANAQKKDNYWVVETEGKSKNSMVKIYDSSNNLLTESKVDRVIDITRKKEKRRLNRMLKQHDSQLLWSKR
jgi:hypothetical protein